ncbi:MAG: DUF1015 domain-containing protein [Gemmatimonadota bacterium]|nr:MAG: DUF1015 domain-containing protein [Gemmatimonadota bacterium]
MAKIFPTASITYTTEAGDASRLLSPPFDVITEDDAARLRALSPYNAVRLVLPEGPVPDRYQLAADRLNDWLASGILARSRRESLWVYAQEFSHGGQQRAVRRALLCAVELAPLDSGEIFPHEHTHRGPKEDRLALMKSCCAQLSPIFFIARDPDGALHDLLVKASGVKPGMEARTEDDVAHALHELPARHERAALTLGAGRGLLIADGHHRYETALELARQLTDRPASRQVLAAIVSDRDRGLILQATHRRIEGLPAGWRDVLAGSFEIEAGSNDPRSLADEVRRRGGATIGALGLGRPDSAGILLKRPLPAAQDRARLSMAEAGIASVVLDRLILRRFTGRDADAAAADGTLSYHQDPEAARLSGSLAAGPAAEAGLFLLPPVRLEDIWAVAGAGVRLPPKSTYFAPKMPSGLLFRPL